MLQIVNGRPIAAQDYYITYKENGQDELDFELQRSDPAYLGITEELTRILETTERQRYTVKKISVSGQSVRVSCCLSLEDWQEDLFVKLSDMSADGFTHEWQEDYMLASLMQAGSALAREGWTYTVDIAAGHHKTRAISMAGPTPLDVIGQMAKTFRCSFEFDTMEKTVRIFYPADIPMGTAYAIETVNLLEAPVYKGDSSGICSRIWPIGKNGLGIQSVHPQGLRYVQDTTHTGGRIISKIWRDERYENAASLYADALAKLDEECRPKRSWQLKAVDLYAIDENAWPGLQLGMFNKIQLKDVVRGESWPVQIREMKKYPYYPERTLLTVATSTVTVQGTVKNLAEAINDPNSEFYQKLRS